MVHAAGLPCAYPTAYGAPADAGRLGDGETVLIHGAAGGVRSAAARVLGRAAARRSPATIGEHLPRASVCLAWAAREHRPDGLPVSEGPHVRTAVDARLRS
jgi:NADPH:quinone reductase-like Zn-dependent oxidoreductase